MDVKKLLEKYNIVADPFKDQFFLVNDDITTQIVELAKLNTNDVVLEIGAGFGYLTREIAKKAGKVIAFEIDKRFKPVLSDLPGNIDLRYEDAWGYVQLHGKSLKKKEYNKVVSNLPYSFAEKFLHNLTFLIYDKVILLIPQSLAQKIKTHPVFSSFFNVEEEFRVDKHQFFPVPRTNSVVINLIKLPDAIQTKNLPLFLRQFIYQHEQTKVKNSLREGLIKYVFLTFQKRLIKNEAKKIISASKIDNNLLERFPDTKEIYEQITARFSLKRGPLLRLKVDF